MYSHSLSNSVIHSFQLELPLQKWKGCCKVANMYATTGGDKVAN